MAFLGNLIQVYLRRGDLWRLTLPPDPAVEADNIDEKMLSSPLFPFLTLPPPDNMDDLCFSSFIELFELFNTRRHQELSSSHNFR